MTFDVDTYRLRIERATTPEAAAAIIAAIQAAAPSEPATKTDIDMLRADMRAEFQTLRAEFSASSEKTSRENSRWLLGVWTTLMLAILASHFVH